MAAPVKKVIFAAAAGTGASDVFVVEGPHRPVCVRIFGALTAVALGNVEYQGADDAWESYAVDGVGQEALHGTTRTSLLIEHPGTYRVQKITATVVGIESLQLGKPFGR